MNIDSVYAEEIGRNADRLPLIWASEIWTFLPRTCFLQCKRSLWLVSPPQEIRAASVIQLSPFHPFNKPAKYAREQIAQGHPSGLA